jgi:hypothetical protein
MQAAAASVSLVSQPEPHRPRRLQLDESAPPLLPAMTAHAQTRPLVCCHLISELPSPPNAGFVLVLLWFNKLAANPLLFDRTSI